MTTHELKTWSKPFNAVLRGDKRYEIRKNDRAFKVGDIIKLREFDPCPECKGTGRRQLDKDAIEFEDCCSSPHGTYSGRKFSGVISYLTQGGEWKLPADLCVLGFNPGP